jgi:hypothetical protein
MRIIRPRSLAAILAVTLAAGCGTATAGPPASQATPAKTAPPATTRAAPSASGSASQRAVADARGMLARFVPPPGAVRLAGKPRLPSGSATMGINATTRVDAAGYWRVNGSATALLAWEKAHISRSFSAQDVIVGPPDWNTVYSLPAVAGVLTQREMNVQFYDVGGATVIMADAMVAWQPPRPATEVFPDSVTAVTVTALGPWTGAPAPVTITSAPVVRRLVALLNTLPVSVTSTDVPCPSGPASFELTFRPSPGGPQGTYAGPGACGAMSVRINGKDQPALQPPSSYVATVLQITGLNWKPVT